MKSILIIIGVLIYLLIGAFVSAITKNDYDKEADLFVAAIGWPIFLIIDIILIPFQKVFKLYMKLIHLIDDFISKKIRKNKEK